MVGVITGSDILAHPVGPVRCFGWLAFFRAVVSLARQDVSIPLFRSLFP
jgi:hypothetical protein